MHTRRAVKRERELSDGEMSYTAQCNIGLILRVQAVRRYWLQQFSLMNMFMSAYDRPNEANILQRVSSIILFYCRRPQCARSHKR